MVCLGDLCESWVPLLRVGGQLRAAQLSFISRIATEAIQDVARTASPLRNFSKISLDFRTVIAAGFEPAKHNAHGGVLGTYSSFLPVRALLATRSFRVRDDREHQQNQTDDYD